MKQGKRIAALLLALLLVFALAACEAKPDASQDNHLDWVYILGAGNQGSAVTKDGCYYIYMALLYYTDFATEKSTVLCTKAGCAHKADDEDNPCDADMPFNGRYMFFEDNTLYYLGDENVLCSRDATGGSLKEWGMLGKKFVEEGKGLFVYPLALCNGYLYYEAEIIEKEDTDGGMSTTDTNTTYIGRYDIAKQKDEIVILLEDGGYYESIEPYAARENGLIYLYMEGLGPKQDWENVDAKKRLEARKKMPVHIKHLDLATGETTTILTAVYGDVSSVSSVGDGKLFYSKGLNDGVNTREVHSYDLVTGKDTVIFTDVSPASLGKGYWRCVKYLDYTDPNSAQIHLYDMNTGKVIPYELEEDFSVISQSEYGLVVTNFRTGNYSYISYDSLADGLQESDLMFLYSGNWTTG